MNETVTLLNDVYRNTKMGFDSLSTILPRVEDPVLLGDLVNQREGYRDLSSKIAKSLKKAGQTPQEVNAMTKLMSRTGIQMKTLTRRDQSHIAKMVIQGSSMGTIDMCRSLNHNTNASKGAISVAQHLLNEEEANIERLKRYLQSYIV